jgi:hypothetical protein
MDNAIIIQWAVILKYVIDILAPLIPHKYRKAIPLLALLLWLGFVFLFLDTDLYTQIIQGVQLWAWAVGMNEFAKIAQKKSLSSTSENNEIWYFTEDEQILQASEK